MEGGLGGVEDLARGLFVAHVVGEDCEVDVVWLGRGIGGGEGLVVGGWMLLVKAYGVPLANMSEVAHSTTRKDSLTTLQAQYSAVD